MQALLVTKHMLFEGFGLSDPHFHEIFHGCTILAFASQYLGLLLAVSAIR